MKSKHIITGVGMLFCLVFFNVPDAAGQSSDDFAIGEGDCLNVIHPGNISYCWMLKIKNGVKKDFYEAQLSRMSLYRAKLTRANLAHASLDGADLTEADLTKAELYKADLTGANLTGAILTNARFDSAILTGAIVSRSKTKGINFEDWKKRGAIIRD